VTDLDLDRWPFAPGQSPFQIKGTAYRGHLKYVEEELPGGLQAMMDALPNEAYREFWKGPFLAGGLYDIYPLAHAGVICAGLSGLGFLEFVERRSRHQAPRDLHGVYNFMLRMIPTNSVARRIPRLVSQVLAFTTTEVTQDRTKHMRGSLHGMPQQLGRWFATVGTAYGEEALRVSGAKEPRIVVEEIAAGVAQSDVPLVTLSFDIQWS